MKCASPFLALLLLLPHCKQKEESDISAADREMLSSLREIQVETELSDEELTQSVRRYCKIFRVLEEAITEGLITMEDFGNLTANLKEVQDNMLESDAMAAAVCLAVLKSHHEGDLERRLPFLRKTVAEHYNDVKRKDSDEYAGFMKNVEGYAAKDVNLQELLKKSG